MFVEKIKVFHEIKASQCFLFYKSIDNQEKFYLYVIVSVSAGVLLLLGLVIGRLLLSRHRTKRDAKFHTKDETLPNGFTDDISEIDADIDLTTPVPVPMHDTR
jgi:nitrogen fixation/metabolism regulation signal transduction histidine kinase